MLTPEETEFFARKHSRFDDALEIQMGACNLRAIAGTLIEASEAAYLEFVQPGKCPAVQLILHQMAHLCTIMTSDYPAGSGGFNYNEAEAACCAKASFETLHYIASQENRLRDDGARRRALELAQAA
jgi:hypothetical protein